MVNRKIRVVTMKSLGYRWRTSQISFEFDFVIRVVYKMIFSIIAKSSESDFLDWNHFVGYVYISIYHLKYVYIPNIRFIRVHVPHLCGTFPIGSGIQNRTHIPFSLPAGISARSTARCAAVEGPFSSCSEDSPPQGIRCRRTLPQSCCRLGSSWCRCLVGQLRMRFVLAAFAPQFDGGGLMRLLIATTIPRPAFA